MVTVLGYSGFNIDSREVEIWLWFLFHPCDQLPDTFFDLHYTVDSGHIIVSKGLD